MPAEAGMTIDILKRRSVANERTISDLDLVARGDAVGGIERENLARAVIHAQGDAVARYLLVLI